MRRILGALALVALMAGVAQAAGGHGFEFKVHGYYIIDFVVFLAVLVYFMRKPLKDFLEKRRASVKTEMDEASTLKGEAEARLAKYESQLANLNDESQRLREEFSRDGERERQRMLTEAEAQAAKIERESKRSIQQESAKVREELEERVAKRALELAEERIKAKLTPAVQKQLVGQFIADLEKIDTLGEFRSAK